MMQSAILLVYGIPLTPNRTHYGFAFFFFDDTASTDIYTLSLHDALPICPAQVRPAVVRGPDRHAAQAVPPQDARQDRKSTRLNSSHITISYAVFCLKKKNNDVRGGQFGS